MAIDREKALQQAQKFIEKRRYDRALEEYQRILREEPNDSRTLLKLGDLQIRMQAFADAMATYDRVGQLYETQGFPVKAVAVYKQIREHIQKRSPDLAERFAHVTPRLAKIYAKLQLTSDAIQAYDEVATRLLRVGKRNEAVATFREMVALDPGNPLTHVRLAEALCHLADLEGGQAAFGKASELLLKLGRHEDAARVVERGLHFRADPSLAKLAAEIYLQRGTRNDGLQALSKLQICFQADPKDLSVLGMLAQAFNLLEQSDKAVEVQKQMAILAREKGEHKLFAQLVHYLAQVAPNDDQVRAMLLMSQPEAPAAVGASLPPPRSLAPASIPAPVVTELSDDEIEEIDDVEEIDDDIEFVDTGAPASDFAGQTSVPPIDPEAEIQRILADADASRRLRLFPQAIAVLSQGLVIYPNSLDLRYRLREVLYEQGDHEGMWNECLTIAKILIEYGYKEEAGAFVSEVIAAQPTRPLAVQLYTEIYGRAPPQPASRSIEPAPAAPKSPSSLPSYDLEGLDDGRREGSQVPSFEYVDAPFGEENVSLPQSELPSFSLDDALDERGVRQPQPQHSGILPLEDTLDQAESLAAAGELEQAHQLLLAQLKRTPQHPLVLEKLQELGLSASVAPAPREESQVVPLDYDDDEELSASFQALDHLEMDHAGASPVALVDADTMFAQFKEGVRSQVDESDTATHYDLGVAYKEMGLVGDAIKEFGLAARDPHRECMCYAMIGLIHLEQNELEQAIVAYGRGLESRNRTEEQELNLSYDLAITHEMRGEYEKAVEYLTRIAVRDPNYRDVSARLLALGQPTAAAPPKVARAANGEDEFERAFDDMFHDG